MSGYRRLAHVGAVLMATAIAGSPGGASAASLGPITIETPEGPVTCKMDPAHEPGSEAVTTVPLGPGRSRITIAETGSLLCSTSMLGEIEVTGTGLPWRLTVNESKGSANLKGSPKVALIASPVGLPSLACRYQVGRVLGMLGAGVPPSLSLVAKHVRLDRKASSALCPALGPVDLSLTLP